MEELWRWFAMAFFVSGHRARSAFFAKCILQGLLSYGKDVGVKSTQENLAVQGGGFITIISVGSCAIAHTVPR